METEEDIREKIHEEIQGQMKEKKSRMKSVRAYFHNLFDLHTDMMSYEQIDEMMEENTTIYGANMWILMLAILIASIGLNVNSTAVIIGAMLISPLMSGILTMGYSLAVKDLSMLKKALGRFGTQVVISLITSTLYFMISPLDEPTEEMIARTTPTIWDVMIALFGGIAGSIGNTRRTKGNVIPGVAIATALMPPLCTTGYGIATMQPRFFLGAFYLFIINTLFIALSAAFVTSLLHVPTHHIVDAKAQKKINRIIATITIVTVIPSIAIGSMTVYSSYMERNAKDYLEREFVFTDTQLVKSDIDQASKMIKVSLVGMPISEEELNDLEGKLDNYNLDDYKLQVTQNAITAEDGEDNQDKVTIAVQEKTISELKKKIAEQQTKIDELEESAASKLDFDEMATKAQSIFPELSDCYCGVMADGNEECIILSANSSKKLSENDKEIMKNWLKTESGLEQVRLFIEKGN